MIHFLNDSPNFACGGIILACAGLRVTRIKEGRLAIVTPDWQRREGFFGRENSEYVATKRAGMRQHPDSATEESGG